MKDRQHVVFTERRQKRQIEGKVWLMARDKEGTSAVQHDLSTHEFSVFSLLSYPLNSFNIRWLPPYFCLGAQLLSAT